MNDTPKMNRRQAVRTLGAGLVSSPWLIAQVAKAGEDPQAGAPSEANCKLAAEYSAKNTGLALLVLHEGKIVFEQYDNGHAPGTPGRLASATKSFWGPAAAALAEDGLLKFDELACETITEWKDDPSKSKITVRHLLSLTAGLNQRPARTDDLYKHAVEAETVADPGAKFAYGPTALNAFGELAKRKLAAGKRSPLDYLKKRILEPLGVKAGDWRTDRAGNAHITNGAQLTARDWLKFGQFLVQEGNWEGRQLVSKDLLKECFKPCQAYVGYGLTFWLNQPGSGQGGYLKPAPKGAKGGAIYNNACPDLVAALGLSGNSRDALYAIPSRKLAVVRFGKPALREGGNFTDTVFLTRLLEGKAQ